MSKNAIPISLLNWIVLHLVPIEFVVDLGSLSQVKPLINILIRETKMSKKFHITHIRALIKTWCYHCALKKNSIYTTLTIGHYLICVENININKHFYDDDDETLQYQS